MAVFNEPTKWAQTLGKDADVVSIPDTAGETDPSIDKIFPSVFSIPLAQGGRAIPRSVLNGLFKLLGDWSFYQQNGGIASYNAAYDYAVGRFVVYNNTLYKCIQANGASSTVVAPDSVSPLGSDYWKDIENQDSTSLIPNQLIVSPAPLTDANLHLLDGALLSGSGAYADYVTMMSELYTADPTANIWTDEATWQSTVSTYGVCGKFVYDSLNNTLRLPKLGDYLISDIPSELGVKGNGISVGFTDGITNFGIDWHQTGTQDNILDAYMGDYGLPVGSPRGGAGIPSDKVSGLTPDVTKSGVIADTQNLSDKAVNVYYYIVVGTVSKTQIQIDIDNVMADLANKADKNFSNVTAPVQSFKDMSVGWGMPDYNSRIDISAYFNSTYTPTVDGFIIGSATFSVGGGFQIRIGDNDELHNLARIASTGSTTIASISCQVNAGELYYIGGTVSQIYNLWFVPCKGAN